MSRDELWKIYCAKNPQFSDDESIFKMTGRGLRKLFEQTFDLAHEQGFANGKAKAQMEGSSRGRVDDLMKDFFRK